MAKTPREHIEEIRRVKFSIGGEPNPLTEDLHQSVKNLSAELYAKDVHFMMELIQNAEDNEYEEGVKPSLEFVITSEDITATGASSTLLIFNNERGFSPKNIESICSVGRSTKKGNRKRGYIGEKGIGFKSVFLITAQPHIFSNGYQIRFNENPCSQCNLGYIVPEWVEDTPTLSVIKQIYGSEKTHPTTTIVLPLKPDKVNPVKQQLSTVHPEVLLFLSKIKQLSVRECNEDPRLNSVSAVSISSETNFVTKKNIDAQSFVLHLSATQKAVDSEECSYHMWRQRFPVKQECRVERRMEVDEWTITLAFPTGDRLNRGTTSPGIYAFLPTEMVTNFPFIIQSDFLLASSRETILMDNPWNKGILSCVPSAFVNAFISLVKGIEDAPISSLPPIFGFLPVSSSPYSNLNSVRDSIRKKLMEESIIPCESYTEQKFFQKPCEVGRLKPDFWDLLVKARGQGLNLNNISSHGRYILCSAFDKVKYDGILEFLGVEGVDDEWYGKCIGSSNFVLGVSEDVYLDLLFFVSENWSSFRNTCLTTISLLKYVAADGTVSLFRINETLQRPSMLLLSYEDKHISWLIDWNKEFRCAGNRFLLAKATQESVRSHPKGQMILKWLVDQVNVRSVELNDYALLLVKALRGDRRLVVAYAHFLYHSFERSYLSKKQIDDLCGLMPLVDNYGQVITHRRGILVPASGSSWLELIGSNIWGNERYIVLSEDYLHWGHYAGLRTPGKELLEFLKSHLGALDVPDLPPPDAPIPSACSPLTKRNAFLLLDWIRNLQRKRVHIPSRFLKSIKEGSWVKISLSGSAGCRPPSQSFLLASSEIKLLQKGSLLVDIPLIDQRYYGSRINDYAEELRLIGVMFNFGEACQYIGNHLMSLADSSNLTRGNVLSILQFIKFLRDGCLPAKDFIDSIIGRRWLRTSQGDKRPVDSVIFNKEWRAAAQISDIPFIDGEYYGEEILSYRTELELLGVLFCFNKSYQLVLNNLKSPPRLTSLTAAAVHLVLQCIRHSESPDKLIRALKGTKCMKTNMGYKSPPECFLLDPEWGCLLQVFSSFPLIDENFYDNRILSYKEELKKIGVLVDFHEATSAFANVFRQQASLLSINKNNVLLLLASYRRLRRAGLLPDDLRSCINEAKWLRTRLGDYRSPKECILYGPEWELISSIALLPLIDTSGNHYGNTINEYKVELQSMGVVVDLRCGAKFVTTGLRLPEDPRKLTPSVACALLDYTRILLEQQNESLFATFRERVNKKWIKTTAGFRPPNECLLYGSEWNSILQKEDGPFIDETFYGSGLRSYKKELNAIGVVVDVHNGCKLLASYLDVHSDFDTIVRIYNYLSRYNWIPSSAEAKRIWIPNGKDDGDWVSPEGCVIHDKNDLFGSQLNVLEKHYEKNLLSFFSIAFGVKINPCLDDFCRLWKLWEDANYTMSSADCCAFWEFVLKHWSAKTEKVVCEKLSKVPVYSGSDGILLFDKHDVFIADDLCLKDLFELSCVHPLFVWYPRPSLQHLPKAKLLEIYAKLGVRPLSHCVQKGKLSAIDAVQVNEVNPHEIFVRRGLFKLILGFLADPALQMDAEKRHESLQCLLNVTVLETLEPITVGYSLPLSSGEALDVKTSRMIRWEKQNSKIFVQELDRRSNDHKYVLEYATNFAEVISQGLLWGKEDHIPQLAELIRLGFIMEFDEAAIEFLMKTKNLELFLEDEEYLSSALPSN